MSAPMSPQWLAEIAARVEAATKGPWAIDPEYGREINAPELNGVADGFLSADVTFIAHARTDVPDLLAEVEQLRAELASYRALDLGAPDGRVSAACDVAEHPTWLRKPGDARGCPWCEVERLRAELAARPSRAEVLADVTDRLRQLKASPVWERKHVYGIGYALNVVAALAADAADEAGGQPPAAEEPTPLRWGLDDIEYGDDDSITVLLSGQDGEPYVLELDAERAAALTDALAPLPEQAAGGAVQTRQCGHDDYHPAHSWADRPHTWCPGHNYETDVDEAGESRG